MSRSLSTAHEIVEDIRNGSDFTVNQQLEALFSRCAEAARLIDPSIDNIWVCRTGEDLNQPSMIVLDRKDSPFKRSAGA
jgi:hypothetical protein